MLRCFEIDDIYEVMGWCLQVRFVRFLAQGFLVQMALFIVDL
jgi:hypothetical protein